MDPTILIKFCEFIVHSKPSNMTLSAFPQKMHEIRKLYKLREDKLQRKKEKEKTRNFVIIKRLEGSNWFGVLIFMFQER